EMNTDHDLRPEVCYGPAGALNIHIHIGCLHSFVADLATNVIKICKTKRLICEKITITVVFIRFNRKTTTLVCLRDAKFKGKNMFSREKSSFLQIRTSSDDGETKNCKTTETKENTNETHRCKNDPHGSLCRKASQNHGMGPHLPQRH